IVSANRRRLDLADQVQRRSQSRLTFLPLGRANIARVSCNVPGCLNLAQQVLCVTADAFSSDFYCLDDTFRVNYESCTVSQTLARTHNAEVVGYGTGRIADHGVLDLADSFGSIAPGFVYEMGVSRNRV